jgi:outer membrane protein TolC
MLVLLISIVATRLAGAQDALSLQQTRALTLSRSATLHSAQLAVDAASLAAQAQGYAALPSISLSGGGSWDYESVPAPTLTDTSSVSAALSASQTLFDGGKILALVKKYGFATEAARESLRSTRISLLDQADSAYFAVLGAQASVDAAASDLDAARLRQSIAQAKIDAGSLSKSAYLQTEADTAGYETSLILARKTLASAKAKLASLTGRPATTSIEQVDFTSYAGLLARLSSLDEAAIDKVAAAVSSLTRTNSPDLANYALSSEQAKLGVTIAKTAYLPTVTAGVSQSFVYGSPVAILGSTGSISLTASMSLDLWNTRNAVDSAAIAAQQADLGGSQGATDLELSVVQALYEWISSAASIGSASKALDYARSNYENVLEEFKLSSATTSDLSTAQALVSVDETALISARYAFLSDLSALRSLAGLEDDAPLLAAVP